MRGCIARRAVFLLAVASLGLQTTAASDAAGLSDLPVAVVAVPNAPVTITQCKLADGHIDPAYLEPVYVNATNRTTHALLTTSVQVRFFDSDGTLIGQKVATHTFGAPDGPLVSGDSTNIQFGVAVKLSEPESAISKVTCRLQAATFSSLKHWTFGETWTDKLLPLAVKDGSAG